jgi:hypothetical protein
MPKEGEKTFTLRSKETILKKFSKLSEIHGRSMNKEIETMMIEAIQTYEKKNGPIEVSDPSSGS